MTRGNMEIPFTRVCTICHVPKILETEFRKQINGKYGRQSACKDCVKKQLREYRKTPEGKIKHRAYQAKHRAKPGYLEKHESYRQTPKGIWQSYKRGAEKRDLAFQFTLSEFTERFWQRSCVYCGDVIKSAGIDRVDSSKGYTIENSVPCCSTCNFMKLRMSVTDFIHKCNQISAYTPFYP
jgi:hypothetical protein